MIKFPRILFGDIHEHILEIEKTINDREAFLICDENTSICREKLANTTLHNIPFLTILSGESNKTLEQVSIIWKFLNDHNAKRNSILFSLGGGVLCDLGGFAAATYKRGIQFINIPTSLLAMVDASIGGKTGFNFHNLKNNIGTFTQPEMILCDVNFLTTLPVIELKSGMAEVFKHAIIGDQSMWNYLKSTNFNNLDYNYIVKKSSEIKEKIVKKDPHEKSQRKVLNFGHTIGHAIETSSLNKNKPNLHGYAIAKGMIIESFISYQLNNISKNEFLEIKQLIEGFYSNKLPLINNSQEIVNHMKSDKKNDNSLINFSLPTKIGHVQIDCELSEEKVLEYVSDFLKND